jgi:hypothetical protein
VDPIGIELKFRHGRMAGLDALGKRLGKRLHLIAQMQCSERWRGLKRASAYAADRVASRTMGLRKGLAALFGRGGGKSRRRQRQRDEGLGKGRSQHCMSVFLIAGQGYEGEGVPN